MNNFDEVLEQCLEKIASGESTVEECLARNPNYITQLEPLLSAAQGLKRGRDIKPSPFFAARLRSELMRQPQPSPRGLPTFFRQMALNVALILVLFAFVSTLFAQKALPGDSLYGLKLASESVWRTVTTDPIGTDLKISDRRITEYMAVSRDETRRARVLNGYHDLLVHFQTEEDEQEKQRILLVLRSHQDALRQAGLSIPELDSYFIGVTETTGETPLATPSVPVERPQPKP